MKSLSNYVGISKVVWAKSYFEEKKFDQIYWQFISTLVIFNILCGSGLLCYKLIKDFVSLQVFCRQKQSEDIVRTQKVKLACEVMNFSIKLPVVHNLITSLVEKSWENQVRHKHQSGILCQTTFAYPSLTCQFDIQEKKMSMGI